MRAILVPVGEMPRTIEVEGLRDLQRAVSGPIEACSWIFGDEPAVYVGEESKLGGFEPNRAIYATAADEGCARWDGTTVHEGDVLDIVYGDFVCIGFDGETGEDRDITEAEAARVMQRFGTAWSIESGWAEALRVRLKARIARM